MKISIILTLFVLFSVYIGATVEKDEKTGLNDDLYVEIKAQVAFVMDQIFKGYKGSEAAEKAVEAKHKIYERYGVTKEELDKYIIEISKKDINRTSRLMQRVAKRTQELMSGIKKEPASVYVKNEVKGFSGIPLYPGAESISGTSMGDTNWTEEMLKKEGYIWYEFGEKLSAEYEKDPRGVDNRIVDFYKEKLATKGWKYSGEGVRTYHWIKGGSAIGISFPADSTIAYRHMSPAEARGNCGKLSEDQFFKAFMICVKAIQDVCIERGIQNIGEYESIMGDRRALDAFNKKIEKTINQKLASHEVTFKRFKEIKGKYNFDEIMGRFHSRYKKEMKDLSLALMILTEMLE